MSDAAEAIQAKRFSATRFREGYDVDDVDDFLDRAVQAVRRGDDLTSVVDDVRFRTVKFSEGYDMQEVDDFLDELKLVQRATPPGTPPGERPVTSTVPEPTLPTGTGGLRRWLFGRR